MTPHRAVVMEVVEMGDAGPSDSPETADFRQLPEPVRLDETTTSQPGTDAPDPTMGRDAETAWLLRTAAG